MQRQSSLSDITPEEQTHWDFKRILIGIGLFSFFLVLAGYFFINTGKKIVQRGQIQGVSTEQDVSTPPPDLPTKEDAIKLLQEAQTNLGKITEQNLTASGAAISKIISDLQALQGGKKSAGDIFCELVCKK